MGDLSVHHVAIKARDVERVAAFYRDVVGLAIKARHVDQVGELRSIWLSMGAAILMIERIEGDVGDRVPGEEAGLHMIAFAIAAGERREYERKLAQLDVTIVHRTDYTLYVLDPEGNRVGLSSYPEVA